METLATRLKMARERRELNQTDLAAAAGMKQSDVSKLETGRNLTTTAIGRLARALSVSAEWLELGEGNAPDWDTLPSQPGAIKKRLDNDQGNDSTGAHLVSHGQVQTAPAALSGGGGDQQPPVSFDEVFKRMRPSEQKRLLLMFAAAFDEPSDAAAHIGGIPTWIETMTEAHSTGTRSKPKTNIQRARLGKARKLK